MGIDEVLKLDVPLYAHIPNGKGYNQEKETLEEHSNLCLAYFQRLLEEKQMKIPLDNLWKCYFSSTNSEILAFALRLLRYAILFHDVGKSNPGFQREKMENSAVGKGKLLCGTNHSLLSAIIYLDFCLGLLKQKGFSKSAQKLLKGLIYINAYVISRHHSDLASLQDFSDAFAPSGLACELIGELSEGKIQSYKGLVSLSEGKSESCPKFFERAVRGNNRKQQIGVFIYARLVYSLLVASDYYATSEYGNGVRIKQFGDFDQVEKLKAAYEGAARTEKIRCYEKESYGTVNSFSTQTDINILRNELFLDAEKAFFESQNGSIYFLESPTGSGKSNAAMNLSFQMLNEYRRKIFYIYPFNTLVEQNLDTLLATFGDAKGILEKIAVINSITPIKGEKETDSAEDFYQKSLLNRQFLNYPFILSTHVSLFQTMFGEKKEDVFGFMQLAGSVIVLDEIQSYKNLIWSEIIIFLKAFAELLDIKVIIMSATLPDLAYLTDEAEDVVRLVRDRAKYFSNPLFQNRVQVSYELLDENITFETLFNHMRSQMKKPTKVLVEFINKKSAYKFYGFLQEQEPSDTRIFLITGDDNQAERKRILASIKAETEQNVILVATQVIEAGVDIDMDIGYKDISKLDSEEQFLGRLNRSCLRLGKAFFFDLDSADKIYKNDIRRNREFTLKSQAMREILQSKDFSQYYGPILQRLKDEWNNACNDDNLPLFFSEDVQFLQFPKVEERMKLIDEEDWKVSVFFNRRIVLEDGRILDGKGCWERYKTLLADQKMDYAEKQYHLSIARSEMSFFIYEIDKMADFLTNDHVGELYYIEDGEQYFENGKLNMDLFKKEGALFVQ
ncbi:CRISPR-associated helicase Cas3' [Anaerovorax odorimutans]|uniref:CRISPR-associated helicase Cas3 n=1 Tax=Anaerovorax odorimutans TaxID=109327 RepID=A0ABT1RLB1_9FIRM|nr:CRISPR-associated helicase Cas3' [Anaerovorax odorimutans]MCQ4635971.1 CRISPR-associated helicase Cas3' [Anaerovorax odorimutans]